jgi:hypothetical protein
LQYERGNGPCVDAGLAGQMFLVEDIGLSNACPIMPRTWPPTACSARYRCRYPSKASPSASRACIEQAKGILMERHKITEDEAFTMLTHASHEPTRSFAT